MERGAVDRPAPQENAAAGQIWRAAREVRQKAREPLFERNSLFSRRSDMQLSKDRWLLCQQELRCGHPFSRLRGSKNADLRQHIPEVRWTDRAGVGLLPC